MDSVLVVGATGGIGRLVTASALAHGLRTRALVRDPGKLASVPVGAEIAHGDVTDLQAMRSAVDCVDAIVFTHGSDGATGSGGPHRIDYGGVATTLRALGSRRCRIALMTSIYVTHPEGAYSGLLEWKRRSERLVRVSGHPYTIVRPSWFAADSPRLARPALEQGDTGDGSVPRGLLAQILVQSLLQPTAVGRTFELFGAPGDSPEDWAGVFAGLVPDEPGAMDGALDASSLPWDLEAADIRADLAEAART